ncbi:MAG: hypothetical protein ACPLXC_03520 [Candidatus Pacearchaeota archaeon]
MRVIGELLKRGFDIYLPLVDIGGIDCIIKTDVGYRDIQIKTREFAKTLLFDVKDFTPRDNFFIICYNIKEPDAFWVIPSKVFKQNSQILKKYGRLRLILGDEDSKMRKKLHIYRNNFFQLREGTKEAAEELKQIIKKKRTGWQWLKEKYPTVKDVDKKIKEAKEKGYSLGYIKVLENLKNYWQKHKVK